jgi:GNAT superfamily N-acetyltransferase
MTLETVLSQIEVVDAECVEAANCAVDEIMRPTETISMADEFPLLLGPNATSTRLAIWHEEVIVAHAASRTIYIEGEHPLQLANIGAVCTRSEHRGLGHATRLTGELMARAREEGCQHAILWSWTPEFWRRQGFQPVGRELIYLVKRHQLPVDDGLDWSLATESDLPMLTVLRSRQGALVTRSMGDAQELLHLPRSNTYVARHHGMPIAYVVIGKGVDYEGATVEWGGPLQLVLALTRHAMALERRSQLIFVGPATHPNLASALRRLGCPEESLPAAWVKPLQDHGVPLDLYVWGLDSN